MIHSEFKPGSACPGRLKVLRQLPYRVGRLRGILDLWECERCHAVNSPLVARRLRSAWRHISGSGRLDRQSPSDSGATHMRLRLSVSRKGGAPNYGSDGAAAELELELDDEATPQQMLVQAQTWYKTLEHAVDSQLATMQAKHPGPQHSPANQAQPQPAAAPMPPGAPAPPAAIVPFEGRPPAPRRPAPEPGWDEAEPIATPAGPPANGYGGRQRQRGGERDDPPRNGAQLLGWANNHGQYDRLMSLAKAWRIPGRIKDWGPDEVAQVYTELTRRAAQPAGQWGGN